MSGLSVIIPSKTASNLVACATAIRQLDIANIIVINDGIVPPDKNEFMDWDRRIKPHWCTGAKPFVFARNMNIGIKAAKDDDVILLNDDAILRTPGGFSAMREQAENNPEYGVISSATNVANNLQQIRTRAFYPGSLTETDSSIAFVCVLIPRRTLNTVGLLDERFTAYGWEDNDYCRRVREAGLKVGVFDGCFVDHDSLRSTFRGHPRAHAEIATGAEIYRAKWGDLR